MDWQLIAVGIIVCAASAFTIARLVAFFRTPANKCHGCSGCAVADLKSDAGRRKFQ